MQSNNIAFGLGGVCFSLHKLMCPYITKQDLATLRLLDNSSLVVYENSIGVYHGTHIWFIGLCFHKPINTLYSKFVTWIGFKLKPILIVSITMLSNITLDPKGVCNLFWDLIKFIVLCFHKTINQFKSKFVTLLGFKLTAFSSMNFKGKVTECYTYIKCVTMCYIIPYILMKPLRCPKNPREIVTERYIYKDIRTNIVVSFKAFCVHSNHFLPNMSPNRMDIGGKRSICEWIIEKRSCSLSTWLPGPPGSNYRNMLILIHIWAHLWLRVRLNAVVSFYRLSLYGEGYKHWSYILCNSCLFFLMPLALFYCSSLYVISLFRISSLYDLGILLSYILLYALVTSVTGVNVSRSNRFE